MHAQHSASVFHVKPDIDGATDQFSKSQLRPLTHTLLPSTIRVGGAKNGGRHRPPVTRQAARWLAPEDGAGAVIHERVPSETDLWGRRLLAGSTPTPGMTALDENRRVSD